MHIYHEKNNMSQDLPIRLFVSDVRDIVPHWHEQLEIVYVFEGRAQIGINGQVHTLHPKDIMIIVPGEVHFFNHDQCENKVLVLQFGRDFFDSDTCFLYSSKLSYPIIKYQGNEYTSKIHAQLQDYIIRALEEISIKNKGYKLAIKSLLYNIVVFLARNMPLEHYSSFETNKQLMKLDKLEKVFKYVEENYSKDISLREICQVANFSLYHFTRFFKDCTGYTFNTYLTKYRLKKSLELLKSTEDSITNISFKCGFNSIKTFNRVFKREYNSTPSQFRKSNI